MIGFDEGDAAGTDDCEFMVMVAPLANVIQNSAPVFAATVIALARSGSESGCGGEGIGGGKGGKAAAADEEGCGS